MPDAAASPPGGASPVLLLFLGIVLAISHVCIVFLPERDISTAVCHRGNALPTRQPPVSFMRSRVGLGCPKKHASPSLPYFSLAATVCFSLMLTHDVRRPSCDPTTTEKAVSQSAPVTSPPSSPSLGPPREGRPGWVLNGRTVNRCAYGGRPVHRQHTDYAGVSHESTKQKQLVAGFARDTLSSAL